MSKVLTDAPNLSALSERQAANLGAQFALCDVLEQFADSLPFGLSGAGGPLLIPTIALQLAAYHRFEEDHLYPALARYHDNLDATFDRLRHEHLEDAHHIHDISEAIDVFLTASDKTGCGEIGYMLRCLFTALRRHAAFERDHLLPLCRVGAQNTR